ncbi:MAG: hypothetical protein ACRENU_05090 [Gemmatimonadaceae bacterium]
MRHSSLIIAAACGALLAMPTSSFAQEQDDGNAINDLFDAFLTANWSAYINGGATSHGRFLLQQPLAGIGERALRSENGWNLGFGGGVDILPRTGFRMAYTYTSSDLAYRTDDGDGSDVLDIDDGAGLHSNLLSLEIVRYLLPHTASFTAYASAGVTGAWWGLDESPSVIAPGGSTQFRVGAVGSFGVQFEMTDHIDARIEVGRGSIRNPFSGNESFVGLGGTPVDEPTRVGRNDFRLAGVYRFQGRDEQPAVTVSRGRPRSGSR